ncbi:MAG: DUF6385 domain-containing protein [Bacillota bacterium]
MPNYRVYSDQADDLKTKIYGSDGTTSIVLRTDSSGVMAIQDNGGSLTVDATDLDIRALTQATDSILIYGNDGTTNRVVRTDSSGVMAIQDNGGSLTVDATNLDIRDLTEATDSILIYGQDSGGTHRAILTDSSGMLQTAISRSFTEASQVVSTATDYAGSTSRDVSEQETYSFAVKNTGSTYTATIKLEISADNSDWVTDSSETTVGTSTTVIITPGKYLRYARIAYKSTTAGNDTSLVVWYQART